MIFLPYNIGNEVEFGYLTHIKTDLYSRKGLKKLKTKFKSKQPNFEIPTYNAGPWHTYGLLYTVESQQLEHLWDSENLFEIWVVRVTEG